jgi:hypothetical protein
MRQLAGRSSMSHTNKPLSFFGPSPHTAIFPFPSVYKNIFLPLHLLHSILLLCSTLHPSYTLLHILIYPSIYLHTLSPHTSKAIFTIVKQVFVFDNVVHYYRSETWETSYWKSLRLDRQDCQGLLGITKSRRPPNMPLQAKRLEVPLNTHKERREAINYE